MTRRRFRLWSVPSSILAAVLLLPVPVRAQTTPLPQMAPPSLPASDGILGSWAANAPIQITQPQLDAFAELIGEPRPVVLQRLAVDPGLVPLAIAAADARMARKSSGKTRTIVGFTLLGVGEAAGFAIILSTFGDTNNCTNNSYYDGSCGSNMGARYLIALLVAAAASGVGLGIGIPGIISMARESEVETAAVDRYQNLRLSAPPPAYAPAQSASPSAKTLKVPLLSFSF